VASLSPAMGLGYMGTSETLNSPIRRSLNQASASGVAINLGGQASRTSRLRKLWDALWQAGALSPSKSRPNSFNDLG
jgi:hypothetical protein